MGVSTVGRNVRPPQDFVALGWPLSFMPLEIGSLGAGFLLQLDISSQPEEDGGADKSRAEATMVPFRAVQLSTHGGISGSRTVRTARRGERRASRPRPISLVRPPPGVPLAWRSKG